MPVSDIQGADNVAGLTGVKDNLVSALEMYENRVLDTFREGTKRGGYLTKMPQHVTDKFRELEEKFTNPEHQELIKIAKSKTKEMFETTSAYSQDQAEKKVQRGQLELAFKAIAKGTSGIQQILSSQ